MAIVRDLSDTGLVTDLHISDSSASSSSVRAVTCSDSVNLPFGACSGISVDTDTTIKYTAPDGSVDSIFLSAGVVHPISAIRVWSTGTTPTTGIHAHYV